MEDWLPSLLTETPEAGFALAIKLSRVAVKKTQPDDAVRTQLRAVYQISAEALIAASQVVAINFQTVSAANNYWRDALFLDAGAHDCGPAHHARAVSEAAPAA